MKAAIIRPLNGLLAAFFAATATCAGKIAIQTVQEKTAVSARLKTFPVYVVFAIGVLMMLNVIVAGKSDRLNVPYQAEVPLHPVDTSFELVLEALVTLDSDLVIIGVRSSMKVETLSRVATTLDMTIGHKVPAGSPLLGSRLAGQRTRRRCFFRSRYNLALSEHSDSGFRCQHVRRDPVQL